MKLLACGDFHLGAGADYGREPHGPNSRLADQEAVLERIADLAAEERVDAVLFAGDAFERRTPTPTEIRVWQDFVYEVDNRILGGYVGIDGNHDVTAAAFVSSPELAVGGDHSRQPEILTVKAGNTDPAKWVDVATLPWVPPARLIASRNGSDRDELHAEVADLLLDTARELRSQIPAGRPSILIAHWSVSGAVTPTGADVGLFREPVLPLADLEQLGFDAIVLGHIHKPQSIDSGLIVGGRIFYVGSPMVLNFGEATSEHGVWLLDTDTWARRFVEISDRPFVTVDADLVEAVSDVPIENFVADETDLMASAIAEHFPLTDAVVRIRYKATAEQARRVDHAALRGLCADAGVSKLYAIQPEIVRADRARVEGVDESIEPMQALDLYIGEHFAEISRGPELRDLTARYLGEVAI